MRILHIDTGREMRGGQRQVLMLLEGLRKAGCESKLLARYPSPLWEASKSAGFTPQPATLWSVAAHSKSADLVHTHDARAHTLAALASRQRFVASRRVAFPVKGGPFSRWKYRRPKRYLAVSQFVAQELQRAGINSAIIDVVWDGVDIAEWQRHAPGRHVVALASSDPAKGRDLVEEASRLLGLPVVFSNHLAADLPGAAVFVYISRAEGLGSAALAAMSSGVPVIASRVGGLPEVLANESGILVENEPHQIARAIRRILDEPALAHILSVRGRERATKYFRDDLMTRATLESYQRALAG